MKNLSSFNYKILELNSGLITCFVVLSLLASNTFAAFAQGNTGQKVENFPVSRERNFQPFQQPLRGMPGEIDSPTATTNVCDLPGAIIDHDDLAYEGDDIQVIGCQGIINGIHAFNSLTIQNGTLVHSETINMSLSINNDVLIDTNGAIDVSARGYAGGISSDGDGPGGGTGGCNNDAGCGGAHAGLGGGAYDFYGQWFGGGVAYGDAYAPQTLGSGGGSCIANSYCSDGYGGAGGGAIHLVVNGTLTLEGEIRSDGEAGRLVTSFIPGGGGAGGSIWLDVGTLVGNGSISADGGAGVDAGRAGMGGGGGRIAVYFTNSTFTGDFSSKAGTSYQQIMGGAGTIYLRDKDDTAGHMMVINQHHGEAAPPIDGSTPLDGGLVTASEPHIFTYFDISGPAKVKTNLPVDVSLGSSDYPGFWAIQGGFAGVTTTLGSNLSLSITAGTTESVGLQWTAFDGLLTMDTAEDLLVDQSAWLNLREPLAIDELLISGGGRLSHIAYRTGINPTLSLTANGITIESGSQINVGGRGYPGAPAGSSEPGSGPGGGQHASLHGSGAGYGGPGGGLGGGIMYGSATVPVDLGSGGSAGNGGGGSTLGAGGNGGGRIHLDVAGAIFVEGGIYANGGNGEDEGRDGGGGSGGSIWIEANTLAGDGVINAQGGSGRNSGGGGGGGRIAFDVVNNSFNGTISTAGGAGGAGDGGIGTILPGDLFSLSKSANPDPAIAGETLTYTLLVINNSTKMITATINDTLPPQVIASGPTSWNVTIPTGGTWTEILTGTVDESASGILTNLLEATVNGTTRSFTLQTSTQDSPISGLAATNSSPAVETEIVVFNASVVSGSGVSYDWDFGDGGGSQGATAFHAYSALGTYTATVTASNNVSSVVTETVVTILEQPSFAGVVWLDLDGDGQQGPGESGLDGTTVSANGPGGSVNTITANGGRWELGGLASGAYTLSAFLFDYEPTTVNPLDLPLPNAGSAQAYFGLRVPILTGGGRLVGRMFADTNGNGLPEVGEAVFAGQNLSLLLPDGTLLTTTVTDSDGFYSFEAITSGTYDVEGSVPAGYFPDPILVEDILIVEGEQTTVHLPIGLGGTIAGIVENMSGFPLSGATLTLSQGGSLLITAVTSANGAYQFGPFPPDDYEISILPPPTYLPFDGVVERTVTVANNVAGTENWTLSRLGSLRVIAHDWIVGIGTFLPVSGVYFTIEGGGVPANYATGFDGQIELEGLSPGVYTVTYQSGLPVDATINPNSRTVSVSNDTSTEAEFTINLARGVQAVCREWGQPAYSGFPCSVEVTDSNGTLVESRSLPNGGVASFTNLTDGTFQVSIMPDNSSWPTYNESVVVSDGTFAEVEYPFNPSGLSSIWGYAFKDSFFPFGTRSTGTESSYADANGLTVTLLDETGSLVASTTTGSNYCCTGYYRFENLSPGVYRVEIELPNGYNPTTTAWAWRTVDFQTATEELDFGFQRSHDGQISGRVYYDYDGDGTFTENLDNARGGVTLELRASDGTVLDTSATASNGDFAFSGVASGEYTIYLNVTGNPTTLERSVSVPFEDPSAYVEFALRPTDRNQRVIVFLDNDMDGQPDPGEQRFGGVTVSRDDEECGLFFDVAETGVTDSHGVAVFDPISRGFGCARILVDDLPDGVFMARPIGINLSRGTEINWMPMVSGGTLIVQPFWDANGDGQQGYGESILTGIRVTVGSLNVDSGPNGASFSLPGGTYQVSISEPNNMAVLVEEPLVTNVSNEAVTLVSVPMQYEGSISGAVLSQGGTPNWSSLIVQLSQTDGSHTDSAIISPAAPNYQFFNMPPGTYVLSLSSIPPGWGLLSQPVFYYPADGLVVQSLNLAPLGNVSGVVYIDKNGNGNQDSSDPASNEYLVTLLNNVGTPSQSITPASDGSFTFTDLQPGVLYAVSLNLGTDPGQPGASITEAPGWFTGSSSGAEVSIGVFPYEWPDDTYNVVYGQVTANGSPLVGAEVGYYSWDDVEGCDNPTSINDSSLTDANGRYQLQTIVLPFIFPDGPYYCVQVINAPGFVPTNARVVEPSYTYSSVGGLVVLSTIIGGQDLDVEPATMAQKSDYTGNLITWFAFRDDNGNGTKDPDESFLPGTVIQSGALTSTAGYDGSGMLTGLDLGKQTLSIFPLDGYTPVGPMVLDIWMNGEPLELPPIGFRLDGALVGSAFADNDGDGWQADDEDGIGNVTITLTGPVNISINTQLDGTFLVQNLPDGQYTLSVEVPSGFAAIDPQNVTLSSGGVVRIPMLATGQINGVVYEDWDGDGIHLADESTLMTPLTITLDLIDVTNLTAGRFLFWEVPEGTYTIIPFADSIPTQTVSVSSSTGSGLALPNVGVGQVRGTVWHDVNQDGYRQPWEAPLSGVVVILDNGASTTTGVDGRFRFLEVTDGAHNLEVGLPEGLGISIPTFTTGDGQGAVIGVAAIAQTESMIFLPMVKK